MEKYIYAIYRSARVMFHILKNGYFSPSVKKIPLQNPGSKCYILCNGPSLRKEFSKLNGRPFDGDVFAVNHFAKSDYYTQVKPAFYLFMDPIFWDDKAILDNGQHTKELEIFDIILQKTDWPIKIMVGNQAVVILKEKFKANLNIGIYGFSTFPMETGTKLDYLFYSKLYAAPLIQNVAVGAIFLAINLGFNEINILGFDHSWLEEIRVNAQNQVCLVDRHFYDGAEEPALVPFYKLYGGVYKMHEVLVDHAKMFYGYHVLNKYAGTKNVKIFNCTEASYVDAFERKVL